jgi:hypothetical protein
VELVRFEVEHAFEDLTLTFIEMNSPAPIEKAPARSPLIPASSITPRA